MSPYARRGFACALAYLVVACGASPIAPPSPAPTTPVASPAATGSPHPDRLGPGGLTLEEEVGAVMMVGFRGALTREVLEDWREHQYGGLLIVAENENGTTAEEISGVIAGIRAVSRHRVFAATDQEGGIVCLRASGAPCLDGARQAGSAGADVVAEQMERMACGLKRAGFDVNLAPVANVWDGAEPFMRERSYGRDPAAVAAGVAAAIRAIHSCGLLAVAKHFPGEGAAGGDPHLELPADSRDADAFRARDWLPFAAAARAGVDMVMLGHMRVPQLDADDPTSMSRTVMDALRAEVGFGGVAISDDLEMAALRDRYSVPQAALRFLQHGGDMVLIAHDRSVAAATYDAIFAAVRSGAYPRERLDASVAKLLALTPTR